MAENSTIIGYLELSSYALMKRKRQNIPYNICKLNLTKTVFNSVFKNLMPWKIKHTIYEYVIIQCILGLDDDCSQKSDNLSPTIVEVYSTTQVNNFPYATFSHQVLKFFVVILYVWEKLLPLNYRLWIK